MKVAVHIDGKEAERQLVVLHQHRDRRRHEVGAVGPDEEIDLVDIDQLRIDARHVRGIGLIVIEDELDRAAHEAALRVHVIAPDLEGEQELLAVGRRAAGQIIAEADADRIGGARREREARGEEHGRQRGEGSSARHAARTGLDRVPMAATVAVTTSPGFMKIWACGHSRRRPASRSSGCRPA